MSLETSAIFIGHKECFDISREQIKGAIIELAEKGVTEFFNGGQGTFDRICAGCVKELKSKYPHIRNILVIPYLSFNIFDKNIFDLIIYPEELKNIILKLLFLHETDIW